MNNRRSVLRAALSGAALLTAGRLAAQNWPERSIRLIVPAAPGPFDAIARLIGERLAKALGQPVVIENIPGATGTIGTAAMARAAPDGYTISLGFMPLTIAQTLFPKLAYDIRRDVAPIVQISWGYNILVVHPSLPVKSVAELVAYARANPGKINYGSGGNGSPAHISAEFFKQETGIDMVHVPFKSAAPAVQELMAGRIQVMFGLAPGVIPHIKSGGLRPLAVVGQKRLPAVPEIPSMAEAGYPSVTAIDWQGLLAPAGTPAEIIARLNREVNVILGQPELRERLAAGNVEVVGGSPEELRRLIAADTERWARVIRAAGIRID
ncbi:MAG: tripartite tricarboxylate transporter substrate binding protein [Burkholderiales bacterium]|nr:tripartite tricarboxylate transporter substrate binding protein [Burkholderiales bacterium]